MTASLELDALDFAKGGGLLTVVAVDEADGAVLMVAHADREALERTLATGEMHFLSRTRGWWHKGATSGNVLRVTRLVPDCDGDAVLAQVRPAGPACHTGARSCFGEPEPPSGSAFGELDAVVRARVDAPVAGSYTSRLLADRNLRLKKLGEEAAELAVACADGDAGRVADEAADVVYHLLVAVRAAGVSWSDVEHRLRARRR